MAALRLGELLDAQLVVDRRHLARDDRRGSVEVEIIETHWHDFVDTGGGFDVVYTDEVIVHFNDLGGFFKKAYSVLRDGGRTIGAATTPEPTVGLVFYDLRSCLRALESAEDDAA